MKECGEGEEGLPGRVTTCRCGNGPVCYTENGMARSLNPVKCSVEWGRGVLLWVTAVDGTVSCRPCDLASQLYSAVRESIRLDLRHRQNGLMGPTSSQAFQGQKASRRKVEGGGPRGRRTLTSPRNPQEVILVSIPTPFHWPSRHAFSLYKGSHTPLLQPQPQPCNACMIRESVTNEMGTPDQIHNYGHLAMYRVSLVMTRRKRK